MTWQRELEQRQKVIDAFLAAVDQAVENAHSSGLYAAEGDGTKYSISPNLLTELEDVYNSPHKERIGEIRIGNTSDFLIDLLNVDSIDVYMSVKKAYLAMASKGKAAIDQFEYDKERETPHGLTPEKLLAILTKSASPIAAYVSKPKEDIDRSTRIVLVTDEMFKGKNCCTVVEAVSTARDETGKKIVAQKTITAFEQKKLLRELSNARKSGRLLYLNESWSQKDLSKILNGEQGTEKSQDTFAGRPEKTRAPTDSRAESPVAIQVPDFGDNIQRLRESVNNKMSTIELEVSEEQNDNSSHSLPISGIDYDGAVPTLAGEGVPNLGTEVQEQQETQQQPTPETMQPAEERGERMAESVRSRLHSGVDRTILSTIIVKSRRDRI